MEQTSPQALEKGIELRWVGQSKPAPALGDPESIARILENLISNALKFCPHGAGVEVESGPGFLEVRDNGPGIPEADRAQLFRKFRGGANLPTGGEESSGLGLYIARNLALRMRGDLELIHADAKGAAFRLVLPVP